MIFLVYTRIMRKFLMLWLPLIIVIGAGVGVGMWFLRDAPANSPQADQQAVESSVDYTSKTMSETVGSLESTKGLVAFLGAETVSVFESDVSKIVFFAPTEAAITQFSKDTAILPSKIMPYHIVLGDTTDPPVVENTRLKTKDGQELTIIKKDNVLYIRDAKGNDVRLRKPIQTKNGKLYIIDKVLLTQ